MFASILAATYLREPLIAWSNGWTYVMFGALILAIICGTWAGAVASGKGRSMQWWFIIGFFLPLIGVIAVYIAPRVEPREGSAKG